MKNAKIVFVLPKDLSVVNFVNNTKYEKHSSENIYIIDGPSTAGVAIGGAVQFDAIFNTETTDIGNLAREVKVILVVERYSKTTDGSTVIDTLESTISQKLSFSITPTADSNIDLVKTIVTENGYQATQVEDSETVGDTTTEFDAYKIQYSIDAIRVDSEGKKVLVYGEGSVGIDEISIIDELPRDAGDQLPYKFEYSSPTTTGTGTDIKTEIKTDIIITEENSKFNTEDLDIKITKANFTEISSGNKDKEYKLTSPILITAYYKADSYIKANSNEFKMNNKATYTAKIGATELKGESNIATHTVDKYKDDPSPSIELIKTNGRAITLDDLKKGNVAITYPITIKNTGNRKLTEVVIEDKDLEFLNDNAATAEAASYSFTKLVLPKFTKAQVKDYKVYYYSDVDKNTSTVITGVEADGAMSYTASQPSYGFKIVLTNVAEMANDASPYNIDVTATLTQQAIPAEKTEIIASIKNTATASFKYKDNFGVDKNSTDAITASGSVEVGNPGSDLKITLDKKLKVDGNNNISNDNDPKINILDLASDGTINYTISVTNDSRVTIDRIVVTDSDITFVGDNEDVRFENATYNILETGSTSGLVINDDEKSATMTFTDVPAGETRTFDVAVNVVLGTDTPAKFINTSTAIGTYESTNTEIITDTQEVAINSNSDADFDKSVDKTEINYSEATAPQRLKYSITIKNTGQKTEFYRIVDNGLVGYTLDDDGQKDETGKIEFEKTIAKDGVLKSTTIETYDSNTDEVIGNPVTTDVVTNMIDGTMMGVTLNNIAPMSTSGKYHKFVFEYEIPALQSDTYKNIGIIENTADLYYANSADGPTINKIESSAKATTEIVEAKVKATVNKTNDYKPDTSTALNFTNVNYNINATYNSTGKVKSVTIEDTGMVFANSASTPTSNTIDSLLTKLEITKHDLGWIDKITIPAADLKEFQDATVNGSVQFIYTTVDTNGKEQSEISIDIPKNSENGFTFPTELNKLTEGHNIISFKVKMNEVKSTNGSDINFGKGSGIQVACEFNPTNIYNLTQLQTENSDGKRVISIKNNAQISWEFYKGHGNPITADGSAITIGMQKATARFSFGNKNIIDYTEMVSEAGSKNTYTEYSFTNGAMPIKKATAIFTGYRTIGFNGTVNSGIGKTAELADFNDFETSTVNIKPNTNNVKNNVEYKLFYSTTAIANSHQNTTVQYNIDNFMQATGSGATFDLTGLGVKSYYVVFESPDGTIPAGYKAWITSTPTIKSSLNSVTNNKINLFKYLCISS